jgi:sugar-specific transcriptional regulator TrmB
MIVGKIETYPMDELIKVYNAHKNENNPELTNQVKQLIKNKFLENPESNICPGVGMCSEYRNSQKELLWDIENIIKNELTLEQKQIFKNIYKQIDGL